MNSFEFPTNLISKIQFDFISSKYKDSLFAFETLDSETIKTILSSFLKWMIQKGHLEENIADLSFVKIIKEKEL